MHKGHISMFKDYELFCEKLWLRNVFLSKEKTFCRILLKPYRFSQNEDKLPFLSVIKRLYSFYVP